MPKKTLAELLDIGRSSGDPCVVDELRINPGGVDPLGLRQINFRLMDQVIPGFNNVAGRIRPYSLLAWAWHRAAVCAKAQGYKEIEPAKMKDFVERMEFLFVWSQFLINPAAELPGRDTFLPYLNRSTFRFGDAAWQAICDRRRHSTSLKSALNYGPAVKYLGWTVAMKERTFACAEMCFPQLLRLKHPLGS